MRNYFQCSSRLLLFPFSKHLVGIYVSATEGTTNNVICSHKMELLKEQKDIQLISL